LEVVQIGGRGRTHPIGAAEARRGAVGASHIQDADIMLINHPTII